MPFNLRNRSLLKVEDLSRRELLYLLDLARDLKRSKYSRTEQQHLKGKTIALIFEKASTRTRCAFEVACFDQGANVSYLDPSGSQIGHKETIKDTARVLGRLYDGIEYRGFNQSIVEELARYAGVPVYNGLTDESHPTQILADFLTMQEHSDKPLHDISFCFVGDCRFNMANSLMIGGCLLGMDVRLASPSTFAPHAEMVTIAQQRAEKSGAKLTITDDIQAAVKGVDYIYTDVWVSMGEPDEVWKERIGLLKPYQVNQTLMNATGNPRTQFLHCLPSFHNTETKVGKRIFEKYGIAELEVTDEVFESEASIVFDQAENRMHTIKAVLVATLGD
ncbi:ornithine carbamoyltransferase [Leptolyngbya ohadii]|uniref:ornithine carbamoyltransferase n=1 Tax=Leptolyngbya ohadii TaxID=1962290 RepID=UPI000B598A78|nr:ornithine carbamoyltransferase [Leptolyngbya ohadii]